MTINTERLKMKKKLIILITYLLSVFTTNAQQAGSLDVSFGGTGIVSTSLNAALGGGKMAIQPDGKIIVAGSYHVYTGGSFPYDITYFVFARYNQNGTLDNAFGTSGVANFIVYDTVLGSGTLADIALQTDGKIIAVGGIPTGGIVMRINSNGSVDNTFDGDGIKQFSSISGISIGYLYSIKIQSNGKIVVIGQAITSNYDFAVIRINSDASLDLSFDGDGLKTIDYGSNDVPSKICLQADGKIIVTGYSSIDIKIARLNSTDGSFDATFGVAGKQSTPLGINYPDISSVKMQSDGKIIVGTFSGSGTNSFCLLRYQSNGILDLSFNGTGIVITDFDNNPAIYDYLYDIEVLPDNKIIAVGATYNASTFTNAIAQYLPNGNLDVSFNGNGKLSIAGVGGSNTAFNAKIQNDGKVLLSFYKLGYFTLARLHDLTNFNSNNGKMITQIGTSNDQANAVAIRPNGKIITGGYALNAINAFSNNDFALVGYNADGSLDYTFGNNAIVKTEFIAFSSEEIKALAIQTDGKIIAAGTVGTGATSNIVIARYAADGSGLDPTFGSSGKVIVDFSGTQDYVSSIVLQTDGKIVIGGSTVNGSNADFSLIRLNQNGTLDNTFDGDGKVTTALGAYNISSGIGLQADGKIVLAGYNAGNFGVVRYNSNGGLDNTFDTDGKVNITIGPSSFEGVFGLVIQPDGKILVSGNTNFDGTTDFAVIRLNIDGTLDSGFGTGGKFWTDINSSSEDFNPSIALSSGKIVLAGIINTGTIGLCRLNANGTIDTGFDDDGKMTFEIGYGFDQVKAMALQTDGKIILAGNYANGANDDFALVSLPACITSVVTLTNPSDNYPNATLPNPQIGKSISATNLINASANVIYRTSSSITLNAGFKVNNGAVFKTEILGCSY